MHNVTLGYTSLFGTSYVTSLHNLFHRNLRYWMHFIIMRGAGRLYSYEDDLKGEGQGRILDGNRYLTIYVTISNLGFHGN